MAELKDFKEIPSIEIYKANKDKILKNFFIVVSKPVKEGLLPIIENTKKHLEYVEELKQTGQLFLAGPLLSEDPDIWTGDGFMILETKDFTEAKSIAEKDPFFKLGLRSFSVRQWIVNFGVDKIHQD